MSVLLIPKEVRHFPVPDQCERVTYSRNFIECSGVCGRVIGLSFGTQASSDVIQNLIQENDIETALNLTSVETIMSSEHMTCRSVELRFYRDEREAK